VENIPFIRTDADFAVYCEVLKSRKVIALDTEFLRVNTFYPKPGLFQINDGEAIVLVDPLTITEWQAFNEVLENPDIVKVFHACEEDIELLHHFLKVEPQSIFDTQIAAAFCGHDFCMGYQRLIKAMLDVELEKTSSRSDWMQRPLTEKQVHYAADDVRYLLPIYHQLHEKLAARNLLSVMEEEYQAILANFKATGFENAYTRIKEAWRLTPRQFSVLKVLATWREKMMRERDLPRKRIATDEALMTLASRSHWTMQQLFEVEGLTSSIVRNYGVVLIEMISTALESDVGEKCPRPVKADDFYHHFKKLLEQEAREYGVDEKMLSKKNYNEQLYWQMMQGEFDLPDNITGWRKPLYEQAVMQLKQA
jgi:ribonuclease D